MSTSYAVPATEISSVAINGTDDRFPVRRIFCIGRNYADHAKEMGQEVDRETPFFFTKPADAIIPSGTTIPYPKGTKNFHHEIEFVIAIGSEASDVSTDHAKDSVFGYGVGIDLTRRDLQLAAREMGRPWDAGKAFDQSALMGSIYPVASVGHPTDARIWLSINREMKQDGNISNLIWRVEELIAFMSSLYVLKAGDLIYTGTPAGVSPMVSGDAIAGGIEGLGELELQIA
jgi:fumarylpyruvate hydrolase